jgi:hypothetical protein
VLNVVIRDVLFTWLIGSSHFLFPPQEQLDQQAEIVAQLGEAAGANRVVQELNDGNFKGITLTVS